MRGEADTALATSLPVGLTLRRTRDELEFLPAALEVLETPASPAGRAVAAAIGFSLLAALTWSILGQVDIVATAPGIVIPAGKVKVVQPLEAGVVKEILVQDGDHVRAGQVLIALDVTVAAAERDRLARDLRQARLDVAGLQALRQDLATGQGLASFAPPVEALDTEVEVTRANITARREEQLAKLAALEQQIAEKQATAAENTATIAKLRESLPLLQQKRDVYRAAVHDAFSNHIAWLNAEQAYDEGAHDLTVQGLRTGELQAAGQALVRQLPQQRASYAHDVMKDLAEAQQRADELAQQEAAAAYKAGETVLTAPINGTVQQLAVHTVGGVVTPAQALLTVVPDDAPVLIEAMVENDDIGFVHAGQAVEVKVKTFPYTRYGLLHGTVLDVSRDAVRQDAASAKQRADRASGDDGRESSDAAPRPTSGYVAHVVLESTSLSVDGHEQKLETGMEVTAEIKTGRRRVISYMLSPLQRNMHDATQER